MGDEAEIGLAPRRVPRRQRLPLAHWIALIAAVVAVILGTIGDRLAAKVLGAIDGCSTSPHADIAGTLIWLTLVVFTPTAMIASIVALVRGPKTPIVFVASVGSILLILGIDGFIVHQAMNWSYQCGR
jgi:hypothetical protein